MKLSELFRSRINPGVSNKLKGKFTPAQISWFLSDKKRKKSNLWAKEDYIFACKLRQKSPRALEFLRKSGSFPVPANNTIQQKFSWLSTLPGILKPVIEYFKLGESWL